jgi:hypothetical protein
MGPQELAPDPLSIHSSGCGPSRPMDSVVRGSVSEDSSPHVTRNLRLFLDLGAIGPEKESSSCHVETLTMERFLSSIVLSYTGSLRLWPTTVT